MIVVGDVLRKNLRCAVSHYPDPYGGCEAECWVIKVCLQHRKQRRDAHAGGNVHLKRWVLRFQVERERASRALNFEDRVFIGNVVEPL